MDINWAQAIASGATAIVVPLVLRGLIKLFPSKVPMPSELEISTTESQKWNLVSFLIFITLAPAIGFPLWWLLLKSYQWYCSSFTSAKIFFGSPKVAFAIPAIFASIGLCALPMEYILRRMLGVRYEAFALASSRHLGGAMDTKRIGKFLWIFMAVGLLCCTFCIFRAKLIFDDSRFVSCGPLTCNAYTFDQIAEIGKTTRFKAPNGNIFVQQELYLRLQDGQLWTSMLLRAETEKQNEIAAFLSEKTGLKIQTVDMIPEK